MDGLTSFDFKSAGSQNVPDHSEQAVNMAERKEHHDMMNRQKHRHIMPGGTV